MPGFRKDPEADLDFMRRGSRGHPFEPNIRGLITWNRTFGNNRTFPKGPRTQIVYIYIRWPSSTPYIGTLGSKYILFGYVDA